MKVKTILNIGVISTFAIVVGSILMIVMRGAPTGALWPTRWSRSPARRSARCRRRTGTGFSKRPR